jgi:hypothetical protein
MTQWSFKSDYAAVFDDMKFLSDNLFDLEAGDLLQNGTTICVCQKSVKRPTMFPMLGEG